MKNSLAFLAIFLALFAKSQVKIGDNPATINSNSLLEMESANKGFLPPRVALTALNAVSPLTGTVPNGMLVYCTGGAVSEGYYYWDGSAWVLLAPGQVKVVSKTANATLTKSETFVLASNDITITLPAVTSADDGLSITVKNAGTYMDLITVIGNSGALIDGDAYIVMPRWFSITMIAKNGNWYLKDRTILSVNTMEVSWHAPWKTLAEAFEFLRAHMWEPAVIKLAGGDFEISETETIDLPYPVTIQGTSYGTTTIVPAAGMAGKPLFRCKSETYFKMLMFDATALSGYGTSAGEDAIRLVGSDTYNEIKDCSFDRFYNSIIDSTNAELWLFECDISNAQSSGVLLQSADAGATAKIAETDFISCARGITLSKGSQVDFQLSTAGFYNQNATDTGIVCRTATFTNYANMFITGNMWNNVGRFIEGFDFSRTDGRDAKVVLESNSGVGDSKPKCFINVVNSNTSTSLASQNTWYKVNWGTNTSTETTKWTISGNRITYQPVNKRNGWIIISGNVSADANSQNVTVGIVKNNVTGTQYGSTTIRTTTADQPFPFTIMINLSDISVNDYFELFVKNETSSGKNVKFQDMQWLVTTE
jgi:hypothetical protein